MFQQTSCVLFTFKYLRLSHDLIPRRKRIEFMNYIPSKVLLYSLKDQQLNLSSVKKSTGAAKSFGEETNLFKKQEFCLYK